MMSQSYSFGNVDMQLTGGAANPAGNVDPGAPFRILILGDFTGRANRGLGRADSPLHTRKPIAIDRDNFDDVLAKMNVEVQIPVGASGAAKASIRFSELDDFHPDRIFDRLEIFEALRKTRRRLKNPDTFDKAAEEVLSWSATAGKAAEAAEEKPAEPEEDLREAPEYDVADLFAGTLEQTEQNSKSLDEQLASGNVNWDDYVRDIVEPYVIPAADPRQGDLIASVDEATSRQMKAVMHHADFQAVEAAWRGLYFLTRRLETDGRLKCFLIDISKEELADDLSSSEDLTTTETYRLLVEQTVGTPGAEPWAVLAANYQFETELADIALLGRLAKIARPAGAPVITGAASAFVGCESWGTTPDPDDWTALDSELQEAWQALRSIPEAGSLGLVTPRFLLRLPYGKNTDPAERFEFEEMPEGCCHDEYLWGNPAFAAALLLGQSYTEQGWSFRPGVIREITGLPLHSYDDDGETELKPCAEALLVDRAIERIATGGLMPLVTMKNQDVIRLGAFVSVSQSSPDLTGRWG